MRAFSSGLLALALLVSCDSGEDPARCSPGEDPKPGCALSDCLAHRNECSGIVYACGETGRIIELGTCDLSVADAAPGQCTPGQEPVPGCSLADCNMGVNVCGGPIFSCDMSGNVVQNGFCPISSPVDAGIVIDGGPAPPDASIMVPVDAGVHGAP